MDKSKDKKGLIKEKQEQRAEDPDEGKEQVVTYLAIK